MVGGSTRVPFVVILVATLILGTVGCASQQVGARFAGARIANREWRIANEESARSASSHSRFSICHSPFLRPPLPGLGETLKRDLSDWPRVFWEDTKAVYTDKGNLLILGVTYGASLTLQQTGPDDTVENSFRRHEHRTFKQDFLDGFGVAGNPVTHFGLAGLWYLVGQQTQDEKTYNVGTKLFRALLVTDVSTTLGKAAAWDDGPNDEWGGFPSGHTSSTFAFASVLHHEYGPAVGAPLYALGGLVAYARLEDDEHNLSDVVMGGVLGLVVGHTIANDNQPVELFGGRLVPYADPATASTGIAWVKPIRYRD